MFGASIYNNSESKQKSDLLGIAIITAHPMEIKIRPINNSIFDTEAPTKIQPTATIGEKMKTVFRLPNHPAIRPPNGAMGIATKNSNKEFSH